MRPESVLYGDLPCSAVFCYLLVLKGQRTVQLLVLVAGTGASCKYLSPEKNYD